jgi:hypothetical protein
LSGPKSGHYDVVSAEELRRRWLSAAQDRYGRAVAAVQQFRSAVAAADATYGRLGVSVPNAQTLRLREAEAVERAAESLTAELETTRQQLDAAVAAARLRALAADGARISSVLAEEPRPVKKSAAAGSEETQARQTLTRILGRLPADTAPEVVARCDQLARQYLEATSQPARSRLLDGIRLLVQVEQDRQALFGRNSELIEGLYQELDGLGGDTVTTVRGILKGLDRSSQLPSGLADRVAEAKAAAEAERDRQFVLYAAASALRDLGYGVGEDFRTAVPASGALMELPHSSVHGLQVRERNRQLMLNVVRFDIGGERDPLADQNAEESFCRDFARLKDILRRDGTELSMLRADVPGQTPMQVLRDASHVRGRDQTTAPGSNAWWANLHMYGNLVVAERDVENHPNVLEGFRAYGGKRKWTFSCHDGNPSYLTNTTYGSTSITVSCARQVTISPQTGRQAG